MEVNHFEKPVQKIVCKKDKNVYDIFVTVDFFEQKENLDLLKNLPEELMKQFKLKVEAPDLIIKNNIIKFVHNPMGPAWVLYKDGNMSKPHYESYWLNGLPANKEVVERLKYNAEFHDHVDKSLNET